jgi:hypothetical protein
MKHLLLRHRRVQQTVVLGPHRAKNLHKLERNEDVGVSMDPQRMQPSENKSDR